MSFEFLKEFVARSKYASNYFKYLSNPVSAILFKMGFKDECDIKVKDGNVNDFHVSRSSLYVLDSYISGMIYLDYSKYEDFCSAFNQFTGETMTVSIDGLSFVNNATVSVALELFQEVYPYNMVDVEGRDVIDIGGNIADTALYFAKGGARCVCAFEPVPPIFDIGLENLDLNPGLKDRIIFVNKAVSFKDGKLDLFFDSLIEGGQSSSYTRTDEIFSVDCISLDSISSLYGVECDVLKIDCEGCEYDIIENCDISVFNEVILEYHDAISGRSHYKMIDRFESLGFSVRKFNFYSEKDDFGILYACKN